ncbi:aminotransferase class III-fold pyridoxal phosphate-dependent enzyme [Paenarthrobacter ureafaciens]|uniref:aminotransferase class III-fold pyridoxal phosphate-dependent enzyme n=1 Tax=Paenarthrobacter ureafaciens TaxID=37931 RepID=UPI0009AC07FA|nr:aminotransferase class III-fold pyridoxal phosphate-dependent enzyme [Paenarthrobacter ureafaciens]GLU61531.1 4-aminobutyrate aminotransferase GabT [Paenarthrobacter ureafaciens]GLU65804.1 4-aminobutyrate aminotransferase GabT [Paenarthrobacter ureafaciens]GLU70119.1 4-aminobutyrate aminotransferase GabT [Paenarthrobacter ureafaciens]GLU74363.1 4-aminobutyrate aminotransferase GabT [Paenarthrobacter ureafaciens]GLU78605.1 4-aminobutyrate aminotransferase GabT [Paenarthrobacter ureafaciens]
MTVTPDIAPSITDPAQVKASARRLLTELPGPRSRELEAERRRHVTDAFGITQPVFIDRALHALLVDVDGNHIIDFASGIAVTSVGAANPLVAKRAAAQLERFTHTCFMVTEYSSFVDVCRWLNENTPGDFEKRTALFSTGAEAVENAIKIARAATRRPNVLVFDEAYHGRTQLTMAMTAKENPYRLNFGPFPGSVFRGPTAPAHNSPNGPGEALARIEAILAENGPETFAAMVIEPLQGEGGFIVHAPGFLAGLREIATRHGIVLVIDEIQAGMGRTGKLFASEHDGIAGDITLTAKALGAGLPLSAATGRAELMNAVHTGGLGGTYAGNPVACEAALAVFELLEEGTLLENAIRVEAAVRGRLEPLLALNGVSSVRGRGAMMAIEFNDESGPRGDLAVAAAKKANAHGVLTLTCGTNGNVIRLLPPLGIEADVLDEGLAVLEASIRSVLS